MRYCGLRVNKRQGAGGILLESFWLVKFDLRHSEPRIADVRLFCL